MTTELLYNLLRFGSLLLLWVFIGGALIILARSTGLSGKAGRRLKEKRGRAPRGSGAKRAETGLAKTARYLAFTGGYLQGKRVPLKISPIIIGRAPDCTVPLNDTYASGHHLRLYKNDNQWFVEDLNSTNGTLLNGAPLHAATPMNIGDQVQIGQTTMEITR